MYGSSMRCLSDVNDVDLWGNYNSGNAGNLVITFEKCDARKNAQSAETAGIVCQSEEEIAEWMVGRYIISIYN